MATESISDALEAFYKDYSANTDRKVFPAMLKLYNDEISPKYHPTFFKEVVAKKYKGDFKKYGEAVFNKTMFANQSKLEAFLAKPNLKTLQKILCL